MYQALTGNLYLHPSTICGQLAYLFSNEVPSEQMKTQDYTLYLR